MRRVYYNDNDPKSAAWLRELIHNKIIADGDIDERSIIDVTGSDVKDYEQCHFFAGIGGWAHALQLAGWGERPVWTGSCPCQPFSCAGKGKGTADERHLWPEFFRLIRECKPVTVFGEQVAAAIGKGWIDGVFTDLETEGYTCGQVVLGAHSVGAPHIRQRIYWMADTENERYERNRGTRTRRERFENDCTIDGMENSELPKGSRQRQHIRKVLRNEETNGFTGTGFWGDSKWHGCQDGKFRRIPIEPEIFPMAHGLPGRVGLLRGVGNVIVPEVAAEFVKAYMDIERS